MIDEKIASTIDNLYQQINCLELEQNQKIKLYTLLTDTGSQFVVEKDQSLPFQRLAQAEFTIQQISLIFCSFDGSNRLNALIQFITPFPGNPQSPVELLKQASFTSNQIICILEDQCCYRRLKALKDSFNLMPDSQLSFLQGLIKVGLTSEDIINFSKYLNGSDTLKALANLLNSSIPELSFPSWLKTISNLAKKDFAAPGIVFLTNILLDNKLRQVLSTHSHFKALCSKLKYKNTNQLKKLTFDSPEELLLFCETKIAKQQEKPTVLNKKRAPLNLPSPDCKKKVLAPTIELIKALKQMRDNNNAELFQDFEDPSFLKNKKTRSTMKAIMGITFRKTKNSSTGYTIKVIEKKTLYSWLKDNETATHTLNQGEIEQSNILENQGDSANSLESNLFPSAFDIFNGLVLPEPLPVDNIPVVSIPSLPVFEKSSLVNDRELSAYNPLFFTASPPENNNTSNNKDKKANNLNSFNFFSTYSPPVSPGNNEDYELDDLFI